MQLIKFFKYLIEFLIIMFLFLIFKILGIKISSYISGKIFVFIGPLLRSKKTIINNFKIALPQATTNEVEGYINDMWNYYGKILAEYSFLNNFRKDSQNDLIKIRGKDILDNIKKNNENVIFISGHFDNFELMAMALEKSGVKLAAIYRPLNNFFMNKIIEILRKKFICKNQIKKGRSNVRQLLKLFNDGYSIALMIDQRVSESIKSPFFNRDAYTTTIPAQFVKKFNCKVVPIYIERKLDINFEVTVYEPLSFEKEENISEITQKLNEYLEKMILYNPSKWIWSHNRWK
tara:strand:+ start:402 stop:1271 length:870 start_codon:yes stop_codon:yes gene_type:complete